MFDLLRGKLREYGMSYRMSPESDAVFTHSPDLVPALHQTLAAHWRFSSQLLDELFHPPRPVAIVKRPEKFQKLRERVLFFGRRVERICRSVAGEVFQGGCPGLSKSGEYAIMPKHAAGIDGAGGQENSCRQAQSTKYRECILVVVPIPIIKSDG